METKLGKQLVSRAPVTGRNGAIATARALSADAARQMFEQGGNAVDAAVAAAFVAGVIEPMETTLAGSGFMVVAKPGETPVAIEFGPVAGLAARQGMYEIDESRQFDRGLGVSVVVGDANITGSRAWGVPGVVAGMAAAYARFGRLSWSTILQPAIRAAYDGFAADNYFALEALAKLEYLRRDPAANETYLADGVPPSPAHLGSATLGTAPLIRQPNLGATLERLASGGSKEFYTGKTAQLLVETAQDYGGILSLKDLADYRARVCEARRLRFRDVDIWGPQAPCAVITQYQMLQIWERLYPEPPRMDDPNAIKTLAEVCWHAFADRYHWLGDPERAPVPEAGLLSGDYAEHIAQMIRSGAPAPRSTPDDLPPWEVFARRAVHDPWAFEPRDGGSEPHQWSPEGATESLGGTTHISLVDRDDMAVALTYTAADHFGSKVVCPRTGLLMDAAMGWFNARSNSPNSIAPGKRPLTNMSPLVLTRDNRPIAALGAPGGRRIVHAVMQLVLSLVEQKLNAADTVLAPRIDASGSTVLMSERLEDAAQTLSRDGLPVKLVNEQDEPFGYELARPLIVSRTDDGSWMPSVDPFTRGCALAIS